MANQFFYKIIDNYNDKYVIQCANTSSIFYVKMVEILRDTEILYNLHPMQACYIGIEYSKNFDKSPTDNKNYSKFYETQLTHAELVLSYRDRKGDLCFIKKDTNERYIMDPRDIALSRELINKFDSSQAFYIGLFAGMKMNILAKNAIVFREKLPNLQILK
ncbi:MAG: hypothetical protein QM752_02655 [Gammaproteobacteria bacterium]